MPAVTCKACGKEWADRAAYLKNPGCSLTNCGIKEMSKRTNNPPAILLPQSKTTVVELRPQQHPISCVCSRCMDARNAEYDQELRDEQKHIQARANLSNLLMDEDDDIWGYNSQWGMGTNPQSKYYEREPRISKNNNAALCELKYPVPKQVKMRVIAKDCVVPSKYDPTEAALYVEVPIAVGASIFPKGGHK